MKIILVEDNLADAEFLEEILDADSSAQLALTHVTRLRDAIEKLETIDFDVILLDLSLPDSHGLETVTRVHQAATSLPILVLTGLNDEEVALQAVRSGAQDYLVKTQIDSHILLRAIRYAIERKTSEIAIRQALLRERELREMKSRFVSMVSHEFRNPLTTIIAATDTLEECSDQLNDEKKQDLHQRIQKAALRMNQLLNDVLIIGSTEAAPESFNPEPLDLVAFCRDIVDEISGQMELGKASAKAKVISPLSNISESTQHLIIFNVQMHPDFCEPGPEMSAIASTLSHRYTSISDRSNQSTEKPLESSSQLSTLSPHCWINHSVFPSIPHSFRKPLLDKNLLQRILSNLLSNAIKYSPTGGHVRFDLVCEPTRIIFQIQDEGIGIPEIDRERLFSAFYRGSNTADIPGTGLGLAIVKNSVDLHGGEISVKSQVGVGTTFTVKLPLHYHSSSQFNPIPE